MAAHIYITQFPFYVVKITSPAFSKNSACFHQNNPTMSHPPQPLPWHPFSQSDALASHNPTLLQMLSLCTCCSHFSLNSCSIYSYQGKCPLLREALSPPFGPLSLGHALGSEPHFPPVLGLALSRHDKGPLGNCMEDENTWRVCSRICSRNSADGLIYEKGSSGKVISSRLEPPPHPPRRADVGGEGDRSPFRGPAPPSFLARPTPTHLSEAQAAH